MKHLLALILLLLALPASAAPACIPGLYGEQFPGSKIVGPIRGAEGWYGYGWCKGPDGAPVVVGKVCAHGECASDLGAQIGGTLVTLGAQLVGSTPQKVYGDWFDANPAAYNCHPLTGEQVVRPNTPRGRACAEMQQMIARDAPAWTPPAPPPPPPPPPVYTHKVKVNGTATTRPVREIVNGKAVATAASSGLRATVGQPCNLSRPTVLSGSDFWAEFGPAFEPGKVALCSKT